MAGEMVWIDLEMTGLDLEHESIIEIATIITDAELNIIAEGPNLAINVILPASLSGFKTSVNFTISLGSDDGPHLIPSGFLIPLQYSTCAPFNCRVLSPIHKK